MNIEKNACGSQSWRLGQKEDGKPVFACLPAKQIARLGGTCFRKRGFLAGNFLHWRKPGQFLWRAGSRLWTVVRDELTKDSKGTFSCTLEFEELIGWSSTLEIEGLSAELTVETRELNKKAIALFLLPENRVLAKLTNQVTCVGELKETEHAVNFVLYTIYPGRDVGELCGNVSKREKVVFLDWNTPGEVPPNTLPRGLYMAK